VIPRIPVSLRLTVPLLLLGFTAVLSGVNVLYHVPRAERSVQEGVTQRVAQEMSRLQSTLEYLLLKGDLEIAQREIAVLAHNHDYIFVALTDDRNVVIAATRRAWLERPIYEALPEFDPMEAWRVANDRRARLAVDRSDQALLGYAGIVMGAEREELRPSRAGTLVLAHDLVRPRAEARAQVLQQSLYWAGWVTALALMLWLVFHFLLTRRTARLVQAAEQLAAGNLLARSGLKSDDELGRLGRAFDAMAMEVAETQTRLRRDLAERNRIEQALRASEEQYRAMFVASIDGLVLWNASGHVVDVNPALARMYGSTRHALLSNSAGSVVDHSRHPQFRTAIEHGEGWHAEFSEQRADGAALELEVHAVPMQYQGEPHVLAIARDITETKRAAAELSRQRDALYQREKLGALGSLLAGVAHELNNPLSVVVARAVMLEEEYSGVAGEDHTTPPAGAGTPPLERRGEHTTPPAVADPHPDRRVRRDARTRAAAIRIREAAERCARIVRTFLAMARQQTPQPGPVDLNEVVLAALELTGYAVRTSSIDVTTELAEDIPAFLADADQLHQVLLNLIINAQQALQECPLPRCMRVGTRFDPNVGCAWITVADNGPGIEPDVRMRIFEPYFTTKPIGVGTGVGLAVSAGIVEAHGGSLTVDCPPEGGTVFSIALPYRDADADADADAEPAVRQLPEARRRRKCKILVIDDETHVREVLSEILSSAEHQVDTATSGREALARLETGRYDIILTDVRMPDMDGLALFAEVEQRWPEHARRVVFVSGDTLSSGLSDIAAAGRLRVLEKPFVPAEVRRIVAEVLADGTHAAQG
jgi:two-component system NtrC family sensor kinase